MPEAPADPKDMADMLEAMAKKLRKAPARASLPAPAPIPATPAAEGGLFVGAPASTAEEMAPWLGEIDVFSDETHVTVTAETRNTEAAHVQVRVAHGRLHIGIGQDVRRELPLPTAVDEDQAYATFRNGVLDVVLPRRGALQRGE